MSKKIDELTEHLLREQVENKLKIQRIRSEEAMVDEDGYPTADALWCVMHWPWNDSVGWLEFIKSIWWMPDWGWHEKTAADFDGNDVFQYHISTGGWSGNESIIEYMQKNHMLWHLTWVQSRRGGHYIFEKKVFEDESEV